MSTNQEAERQSFDEYTAVEAALKHYIDGAYTGDGDAQRSVWMDHARIVGSVDGQFMALTVDEFIAAVKEQGPAPNVSHHVVNIEITGSAATARIEFIDWNGYRFTDFFVMAKQEGTWRISGKVFDSHSRN